MTDEVTPTREQCVAWLTNAIRVERNGDVVLARCEADAILSHLRTPRVEAAELDIYVALLDEILGMNSHFTEVKRLRDFVRALSRRPSEAVDGARPAPSRRLTAEEREALTLAAGALEQRSAAFLFGKREDEYGLKLAAAVEVVRALASEDGAAVEPNTHNQP